MFVDLFVGSEAPSFVSSPAFLQLCRGALSPVGVAAFNLPAADAVFVERCRAIFGRGNVFSFPVPASANVVVLARQASSSDDDDAVHVSHRHFYRRAQALQKSHALPYDLSGHYPFWWCLW
ncbi:spermidine synthase [Trypanosoma grayi]|uniref:spermidine synthase n=1 Tax=Trypanosoma grayi TaxID=71804 RepID=UPI0004F427F6|nr:spermidine synthase [Trypanosoma grayi]KEG06050.1 spermidine synthase [Trypanosoma grayi]